MKLRSYDLSSQSIRTMKPTRNRKTKKSNVLQPVGYGSESRLNSAIDESPAKGVLQFWGKATTMRLIQQLKVVYENEQIRRVLGQICRQL